MRRLYFLIPDVESAKVIVDELLLARIEARHIHIAGSDHHVLTEANLPEANLLQESDFVPAVERGLAIGGATGILAGIAAVAIPGAGLALGGGAILGIGLAGAGVGAWISGMIGVSVPSSRLTEFENSIKQGKLLMMVDVPKARVDDITDLVKLHHPEALVEGTEPVIPAFP
ncbi:MAG: DUF1269 domain-containing protein [Gammaproteobacteria bacterium]|nr:DUF1269 domain-containing protein [Gammaproteobacteria bacterium]MDH5514134.1 DUF1269 domain-containing protein [Gammaproteobacteria bacterium]